ncbi:MAG TPA: hypothetical protein VM103_02875 [Candidatus Paceibacterota bacterium]|nr:hypothetical protein [Candidatus Paceibacterota bacterium]
MNTSVTQLLQKFGYGEQPQPSRDWFVLLIISALVLAVSALWNVWLYNQVLGGGTLSNTATSTPASFTRASVEAVERVFEARASEEVKYASGEHTFTDPSK